MVGMNPSRRLINPEPHLFIALNVRGDEEMTDRKCPHCGAKAKFGQAQCKECKRYLLPSWSNPPAYGQGADMYARPLLMILAVAVAVVYFIFSTVVLIDCLLYCGGYPLSPVIVAVDALVVLALMLIFRRKNRTMPPTPKDEVTQGLSPSPPGT
jgi:hypothetical protein